MIVKKSYLIELDEELYNWLKATVQNPLYNETPETEKENQKRNRRALWDLLQEDEKPIRLDAPEYRRVSESYDE